MGLLIALITLCAGLFVLMVVAMWRVFEKAEQPGWASIIPVYNTYIMLKIGGKPWWWLLLMLIPFVNFVLLIWTYNMISKSFGKDEGFTVGLLLLSIIFWPILGFGDSKYQGPFGDRQKFEEYRKNHQFDFEQ
jgi:hypothetical protein